jgi:hypothetical protein
VADADNGGIVLQANARKNAPKDNRTTGLLECSIRNQSKRLQTPQEIGQVLTSMYGRREQRFRRTGIK